MKTAESKALVVLIGKEGIMCYGRVATIIEALARQHSAIDAVDVGQIVIHLGNEQVKIDLTQRLPPVRL